MYLMGSTRCGISAKQIQRETGVSYKTAWRIFNQIRKLMGEELRLGGAGVEVDEMYHGGRRKGEAGRRLAGDKGNKPTVTGIGERKGGRVCPTVNALICVRRRCARWEKSLAVDSVLRLLTSQANISGPVGLGKSWAAANM